MGFMGECSDWKVCRWFYECKYSVHVIASVVLMATICIYHSFIKHRKAPPGPKGVPFLGRLPYILFNTILKGPTFSGDEVNRLGKKYKKQGIWSEQQGTQRICYVEGYPALKELMDDVKFEGRPKELIINHQGRARGLIFSEGILWDLNIRLCENMFLDLADKLDRSVQEDVNKRLMPFIQLISKKNNGLVDTEKFAALYCTNVLMRYAFNAMFDYNNKDLKQVTHDLIVVDETDAKATILYLIFPDLCYKGYFNFFIDKLEITKSELRIRDYVIKQAKKLDDRYQMEPEAIRRNPQSYLEAYAAMLRKKPDEVSFDTLVWSNVDVFLSGTFTSSEGLRFTLMYLAKYPAVQKRLHDEIQKNYTPGGSYFDYKNDMPYLMAFLEEAGRMGAVVPLGIPHRALHDAKFRGYDIESTDIIFINMMNCFYDPEYFPKPNEFKPERFLVRDPRTGREKFQKSKYCFPFAFGKRVCQGTMISLMEYFHLVIALVTKYEIGLVLPPKVKELKVKRNKPVRQLATYYMRLKARKTGVETLIDLNQ